MATAMITGGTSGIGHAFARELAGRGTDLVLVARDEERLARTAAELHETFGVHVETHVADLSDRADVDRIAAIIEDPAKPLDWFINNAGFGLHSTVLDPEHLDEHRRALDVMCFAVLVLGGAAGRAMRARGHGRIINVASTAGFIYTGNYSAVKAWAYNYSESLGVELAGTGVTVTALCPGWVRTEFHTRAGIKAHSLPDFVWIDMDTLIRSCLDDAERGKAISVPSWKWKAAMVIVKVFPRSFLRWFSRKLTDSRKKK